MFEHYILKLKDTLTGRLILAADAEAQKANLLAMLAGHTRSAPGRSLLTPEWHQRWWLLDAIFDLLRRRLPIAPAEVVAVREWTLGLGLPHWHGLGELVPVLADGSGASPADRRTADPDAGPAGRPHPGRAVASAISSTPGTRRTAGSISCVC